MEFGSKKYIATIVHVGFVFLFINAAFMALQVIESSLNYENGLGTLSLSLLYGVNFFSALFIGPPLVNLLTPKWTMFISFLGHTFFIVVHFWPSWNLFIVSSFVLGVLFSTGWVANGTYITVISMRYSNLTGKNLDRVLQLFNGIFYMLYSLNGIPGNLASSLILNVPDEICEVKSGIYDNNETSLNDSFQNTTETYKNTSCEEIDFSICGPNHCPYIESHTRTFKSPEDSMLYSLLGFFLALNLLGVFLCALLPSDVKTKDTFKCKNILSTLKILGRRRMQFFLLPLFVFHTNDTLFYSSFAQSFVNCAYGIDKIGFAALAQAGGFFLVTLTFSLLAKTIANVRQLTVFTAMLMNVALMVTWLLYEPEEGMLWVVLVLAALHGLVHGIYKVQFGAMTSLFFPDDPQAAFSIYNVVFTLANSFTFCISFYLCFEVRMYIYFALLFFMAIFYGTLEYTISKEKSFILETQISVQLHHEKF